MVACVVSKYMFYVTLVYFKSIIFVSTSLRIYKQLPTHHTVCVCERERERVGVSNVCTILCHFAVVVSSVFTQRIPTMISALFCFPVVYFRFFFVFVFLSDMAGYNNISMNYSINMEESVYCLLLCVGLSHCIKGLGFLFCLLLFYIIIFMFGFANTAG